MRNEGGRAVYFCHGWLWSYDHRMRGQEGPGVLSRGEIAPPFAVEQFSRRGSVDMAQGLCTRTRSLWPHSLAAG